MGRGGALDMGSAPLETSSGSAPCGVVIRKRVPTASSDVQSSQYVHSGILHRRIAERACKRVHLPSRCWTNRSREQTSLGVLSGFQLHLSGTRCQKHFSSVILCRFENPDLKLFCPIRLLLNTDPTCRQRL